MPRCSIGSLHFPAARSHTLLQLQPITQSVSHTPPSNGCRPQSLAPSRYSGLEHDGIETGSSHAACQFSESCDHTCVQPPSHSSIIRASRTNALHERRHTNKRTQITRHGMTSECMCSRLTYTGYRDVYDIAFLRARVR